MRQLIWPLLTNYYDGSTVIVNSGIRQFGPGDNQSGMTLVIVTAAPSFVNSEPIYCSWQWNHSAARSLQWLSQLSLCLIPYLSRALPLLMMFISLPWVVTHACIDTWFASLWKCDVFSNPKWNALVSKSSLPNMLCMRLWRWLNTRCSPAASNLCETSSFVFSSSSVDEKS